MKNLLKKVTLTIMTLSFCFLSLSEETFGQSNDASGFQMPDIVKDAKIPDGLTKDTVYFIKYMTIPLPYENPKGTMEKMSNNYLQKQNDQVDDKNKKLMKVVDEYPFPKKVVNKSEFDDMRGKGLVKYALVAMLDHQIEQGFKKNKDPLNDNFGKMQYEPSAHNSYIGVIYDTVNNKYLVPEIRKANYETAAVGFIADFIKKNK